MGPIVIAAALVAIAVGIPVCVFRSFEDRRPDEIAGPKQPSRVTGSAKPEPPWQLPTLRGRLWARYRVAIVAGIALGALFAATASVFYRAGLRTGVALQRAAEAPRDGRLESPESDERRSPGPIGPPRRAWPSTFP